MNYVDHDQQSALLDLIGLRGEIIFIEDEPIRAFIQRETETQEASDYGADDIQEEITATFRAERKPEFSFEVTIQSRRYAITDIENIGGTIYTITLEND